MKPVGNPCWRKRAAWATVVALAVGLCAPPALAAEPPASAAQPPQAKPTLAAAALARAAALDPGPRALAQQQSSGGSEEPRSFFKSPKGAAVLILMAAGIGWTLYSNSHDRIKSPIR